MVQSCQTHDSDSPKEMSTWPYYNIANLDCDLDTGGYCTVKLHVYGKQTVD